MIYHLSIDALDPRNVAQVIAELWGGVATPFPSVMEGSWIALAGDARNSAVEVYPRGTALHRAEGDGDAYAVVTDSRPSATHFAMATNRRREEVFALALREGWPATYRKRGGAFGVIELWIEGSRMVEVLTPEMQAEYLEAMTVTGWTGQLEQAVAMT